MSYPVTNFQEVLDNARSFAVEIESSEMLQKLLSQFQHWYYFDETKSFAPSKYVGYYKNSAAEYERSHATEANGRVTEAALKKFFKRADQEQSETLYKQLEYFLGLFDKKPHKKAVIHVKK